MMRGEGQRPLVIGLAANTGLVAVKLAAGIFGHSQALLADALNSLLDVVAGAVAWVGFRVAEKPPDATHHYGHQNAETIAALFVGLTIFATGGIIIRDAIVALLEGTLVAPALWTVVVAAGVIVIKLILYLYTRRVARRSPSLVVSATATDHLMDVAATGGALIGVAGAQFGWVFLDPLAAFWVAGIILLNGVNLLRANMTILLGKAPSDETMRQICATLTATPGVLGLHRTKVRTAGTRLWVDSEILVDGDLVVSEAHLIASLAGDRLIEAHPEIAEVLIHVEPHSERRATEGADPLSPRVSAHRNNTGDDE